VSRPQRRRLERLAAVAIPSLLLATLVVAVLEGFDLESSSAVYLVAVVATAYAAGTLGAVVASVASFVLYNLLFVEPRFTLTVSQPDEVLNLLLLLFVGIVVGQLAALQRARAEAALAREQEALALSRVSRTLATRTSTESSLTQLSEILARETHMARVWVALGEDDASERIAADSTDDPRPPKPMLVDVLRPGDGDGSPAWVRVHQAGTRTTDGGRVHGYRVRIATPDATLGSIWAMRARGDGQPDSTESRLLAATADQLGQAIALDRLAAESQAAEIARQSDRLKSALLQSVSHDLRTPLATIRAAAGSLRPGNALSPQEQGESVDAIDREVEYLDRLVTNLLDLSRIEAGALKADLDVYELDDLVGQTVGRLRTRIAPRPLDLRLDAPPVTVDPVFLDAAVTNLLENAVKYTGPDTPIRVQAAAPSDGQVRLTIEDGGAGVPDDALGRLFEKFYRVPGRPTTSRSGTGIGLAVVRGLVEAMAGRVGARRSELGGLAVDLDLQAAPASAELEARAAHGT
jgi:two-component system sensor histidine kinase KdpD